MERYDIAVIGAGAAGLVAAQTAVAMGRRTLLVEADRLGGECTWSGCVPSKALIEAARLRHDALRAPHFGVTVSDVAVDFPAVMAHVHDVIARIARFEDAEHLEAAGVAVRRGRARIAGATTLTIDGTVVAADRIVVCTGSAPAVPPIDGLAGVPHLTNETLFGLEELPGRLVIIGAGPIGLEMAQAFTRLGSEVEVLDIVPELLPREDPDIAALARTLLEEEGIRFTLGAQVRRVGRRGRGVAVTVAQGDGERQLGGDALLVATGRRPRLEGLGLEELGVAVGRQGITVDEHCRTSVPTIYAAGDVTGLLPFTHVASYQGRIAASNAAGARRRADYRVVPWVTFIEPEIAHLGMTEPQARERRGSVEVATLPYTAVDRAVIRRETRGLIKIIAAGRPVIGTRVGGGEIVGAHLIGPGAGDAIHECAVAMQTRSFTGRLAQTIHAYPTLAMGVQQAVAHLFPLGRAIAGNLRESLAGQE